jgi:nitrate reductase cytochrome c-type subunit
MIRVATYLLIALLIGINVGCKKSTSTAPSAKQSFIIISCDTAGWIVPCGCTANQSGGILRRATYLNQLQANADVLYADAGGAPAGNSPYQQVKFESILAGEKLMGISAHNLGASELAFGPAKLRDIKNRTASPLLSANTRDSSGAPLTDAVRIVPLAGKRIAIVGLVSPVFATDSIRIDDPRTALAAVESAHQGEYDSILVLAYFPEDQLQKFAAASPEVDAVIGGPTGQSIVPRRIGPTLLGAATNKGKFLVKLSPAASDAGGYTGEIVEMGPTIGNDPVQMQNLNDYLARLRKEDFSAEQSALVPPTPPDAPANYRVAGNASCVSCHSAINTSCQATHHMQAWATLVGKGFEVDSYCQKCHTTAYGLPGGFQSRASSMALTNVGCESCHGPSLAHVADPHVHTPYTAFDQCIRCHDHENSPQFDRTVYWRKIQHGNAVPPVEVHP